MGGLAVVGIGSFVLQRYAIIPVQSPANTPPIAAIPTSNAAASEPPQAPPAPTTAPAQPTTVAAGAKFTCSDKLGCVDIDPNDPVYIAYAFVTSGDNLTLATFRPSAARGQTIPKVGRRETYGDPQRRAF
jgi:hypothetical protein